MRFSWMVPAGLLAVVAVSPAEAQRTGNPADLLLRADADGDGRVSVEELRAARDTMFGRLDRNGDGVLTSDDRPRLEAAKRRLEGLREQMDADGDGQVTKDEFVNGPTPFFTQADTNQDGFVDAAEIEAARANLPNNAGEPAAQ